MQIEKIKPDVPRETLGVLCQVGRASVQVSALYHAGGRDRHLAKALKHLDRAYEQLARVARTDAQERAA